MACSVVRSPILRNSTVRHYAAAAAAQAAPSSMEPEVLKSNVVIAVAQPSNPISQVSVVFRVGSRNETYATQGICHHLRIAASLSTKGSSGFAIAKNVQQLGGSLTATVDRESIAYTLQVTRDHLDEALQYLLDASTKQVFKPWEIADELPRLRYELSTIPETTRVMELLHKAAYRTGLGYSLFSPKRQVGKIDSETMQNFVNTWFTASRCAVVGTGVTTQTLSSFAAGMELGNCANEGPEPAKFAGGEIRKERNSEIATVAVAVEGAALNNDKDTLACAILQRAAGTGPRVKWGSSPAPLYNAVASAAGSNPFAVSGLNATYSDSGLFGFILSAPANAAGDLTRAACGWLKNPKLSECDINRGKAILKTDVYSMVENSSTLIEDLGQQAIMRGKVASTKAIISEIEKLSAADIESVACRMAGKPMAMAAIGNIACVPYKDQLK